MISNERPSPYGYRPALPPRPPVQEDTLKYGQVEIEQTTFVFMLKANPRGRFLRITEKSRDGYVSLIIPDSGMKDFHQRLLKMAQAAHASPLTESPAASLTRLTEHLQIERKSFTLELNEDPRGRFLRIVENAGGRSNVLIVSASGLDVFNNLTEEMVTALGDHAVAAPPAAEWTPQLDDILKNGQMVLGRRSFTFQLKKNAQGRFLRIVEDREGHLNTIIIPAEGLDEFKTWVIEMAQASHEVEAVKAVETVEAVKEAAKVKKVSKVAKTPKVKPVKEVAKVAKAAKVAKVTKVKKVAKAKE